MPQLSVIIFADLDGSARDFILNIKNKANRKEYTSLVSDWLSALPPELSAAWLSLEDSDNDPTRFFAHLIGALQRIDSTIGREPSPRQLPPPDAVMSYLINDITAVSQSFVLVLGDQISRQGK